MIHLLYHVKKILWYAIIINRNNRIIERIILWARHCKFQVWSYRFFTLSNRDKDTVLSDVVNERWELYEIREGWRMKRFEILVSKEG